MINSFISPSPNHSGKAILSVMQLFKTQSYKLMIAASHKDSNPMTKT